MGLSKKWVNKMRTKSENQKKHTNKNPIQRFLIQKFHHKVFKQIEKTGMRKIIDIGCGEGYGINALKALDKNLVFFGLDNRFSALAWGNKQIITNEPVLCGNAMKLPFENDAFPLITCMEVLEHLTEPDLCLQELIRISSEYLIISVPHEPFFRIANFMRGKNIARLGNDIGHVNWFNRRKFKRLISTQNLEILNHTISFPWQIVLARKI